MQVILDMVISPNGYIARQDGSEDWLPEDGWEDFKQEANQYGNIVMGRETYELVTALNTENFDAIAVPHKVIVSTNKTFKAPEAYTIVSSPGAAIEYLEDHGIKQLYLIGGGKLNSSFMKAQLVHELHLTISPYILGTGRLVFSPENFECELELISSSTQSNGSIKIHYKVLRNTHS